MIKKTVLILTLLGFLAACSKTNNDDMVIKVASHTEPMTDIVLLTKDILAEKGYTLELVRVSDNVQANIALNNKEVDANFFQHEPFMKQFNEKNNASLVSIQPIYDALVGFYSKNHTKIDELPDGAMIAIPNDTANLGRALRILHDHQLISLKEGTGYNAKVSDIIVNTHNFQFLETDLLTLNQAYEEVDLVFNYPTYIGHLGLKPKTNALLLENIDQTFAISLVAREDNASSAKIKALKEAMTSSTVHDFLTEKHGDTTVPAFD